MTLPVHSDAGEQTHHVRILGVSLPTSPSLSEIQLQLKQKKIEAIYTSTATPVLSSERHRPDILLFGPVGYSPQQQIEAAARVIRRFAGLTVIVLVPEGSESTAVAAFRAGIHDYIPLPTSTDEVVNRLLRNLAAHKKQSLWSAEQGEGLEPVLVGQSEPMIRLREAIHRLAETNATVLIRGETGTGKDVVAALIHRFSARSGHPFVPLNCAAIPDSLLESELFGYQRGAFTGADCTYEGKLRQANGGTVFLDEIGDMTLQAQAKLLRVIESKQVYRLGGKTPMPLDVRILAATNQDLDAMMKAGTFRKDLFYRLNVAAVQVPPLRERRADISLLVNHFIDFFNRQYSRAVRHMSSDAMAAFLDADWPGNVRELKSCIELSVLNTADETIIPLHLPDTIRGSNKGITHRPTDEETRIVGVLTETRWNITRAAEQLQWSRMTLYRKLAKFNLVSKNGKPA